MEFLYVKALHLIFIVTWFAGIFYIVRLFVYHTEAQKKEEPEKTILSNQFKIMQKRLWYGITWPSAILTLIFAGSLIYLVPSYLKQPFMHVKLAFVLGLYLYHFSLHRTFRQLQNDIFKHSSTRLRIWNEVATLFLVAIVFVIVLKDQISWIWGVIGLVIFALLLTGAIYLYKKRRQKGDKTNV